MIYLELFIRYSINTKSVAETNTKSTSQTQLHIIAGWTNFTTCYTDEMKEIMIKLYSHGPEMAKRKMEIAETTRVIEIFGLR